MGPNGEVSVYRESLRRWAALSTSRVWFLIWVYFRLLKDLEYYKTQKIVTYEELKNEIDEDNEEYIIRYKVHLLVQLYFTPTLVHFC